MSEKSSWEVPEPLDGAPSVDEPDPGNEGL